MKNLFNLNCSILLLAFFVSAVGASATHTRDGGGSSGGVGGGQIEKLNTLPGSLGCTRLITTGPQLEIFKENVRSLENTPNLALQYIQRFCPGYNANQISCLFHRIVDPENTLDDEIKAEDLDCEDGERSV